MGEKSMISGIFTQEAPYFKRVKGCGMIRISTGSMTGVRTEDRIILSTNDNLNFFGGIAPMTSLTQFLELTDIKGNSAKLTFSYINYTRMERKLDANKITINMKKIKVESKNN